MLHEKWSPTPLITDEEKPAIPIVDRMVKVPFRRLRGMLRLMGLFLKFLLLKIVGRLDAGTIGRSLGDFCQSMGVLWIKVGQLMAMRSDLFPPELCVELSRLQERAEGFEPRQARMILEEELGRPLSEVFSKFQDTPCAAASIAQVHKAFLAKEKAWVAIKVRRPEVDMIFNQDMAMIRFMFMTLHRFSVMPFMRWPDMMWELEQIFTEEMDYRYEVSNQERLRKTLRHHNVYVPRVFGRYCTRKILVMEYVDAVSMTDYLKVLQNNPARLFKWRLENNIKPETIGRNMLHSYLRQVLEDNLFHADLHPGNIFLLRNNRIALLDFGSVGSSEGDMMRKYDVYLEALSTGQFAKAIDIFLLMMPNVPSATLVQAKEELQRRLHAWDNRCRVKELPYKEKSTVTVSDEMTRVMGRYGVTINWAFFKMLRGWMTMDASLRDLMPEADLPRMMQDYSIFRHKRQFKNSLKQLPGDLLKLQNLIDYPREFSEMAIYRGASVRRLAQVFEGTATRVSRLAAMVIEIGAAFCFVFTAAFGFLSLAQHSTIFKFTPGTAIYEIIAVFPPIDPQIWLLLILFMVNGFLSLARLGRRFRQQE